MAEVQAIKKAKYQSAYFKQVKTCGMDCLEQYKEESRIKGTLISFIITYTSAQMFD